ncbi:MAG TPA: exosortase H [Candidatus Binatia bacterium]|nr:exosortase H [Candidatus Binatia bacterium]
MRIQVSDGGPPRGSTLRFGVLFLCIIGAFVVFDLSGLSDRIVHQPLAECTARIAAAALAVFGNARALGTQLQFNGFEVVVVDACDGVLPILIYIAAILAFPSRFAHKAWGILIGLPAVLLVNLVRVITLMIVGARWPAVFEQVHLYVWQACVIAFALAAWIVWAEISVRQRAS